ncbi:class I SAM-dependent methyltransferase [Dyella humicola]|uniref:class I SAM-dependent methyltransferase n=1 Tax=Dyella humicola TaxID=2992126 RepID=UPI00224DCC6C|nr:methyltransferase domain-containing protein [Dyella humicola]
MTIEQDRDAYIPGFAYYGDNILLLKATLEQIVRRTREMSSIRLLSLGVGHRFVVKGLLDSLGDRLSRHVIIEGSAEIIDLFNQEMAPPAKLELVQSFFEDFHTDERFDVIEMGFILEHVEDPGLVLQRFKSFLAPGGRMMIAVPNAFSLHRLIGQRAGLMDDLHSLSEADRALGHRRYFDPAQLDALISAAGLDIIGRAGLMLKPFTTGQMDSLQLSDKVREAMDQIGFDLPDICNGLFVEARPCR